MSKEKGRLADYRTLEAKDKLPNLTEIEGDEVTITDVEFVEGDHGLFAIMDVVKEDGTTLRVASGGMLVMDAVQEAVREKALPLQAKFTRPGRAWLVE